MCEEGLLGKIYAQDLDAIKYYLSKKGQERGYSESGCGLNQAAQLADQATGIITALKGIFNAD